MQLVPQECNVAPVEQTSNNSFEKVRMGQSQISVPYCGKSTKKHKATYI